MDDELSQLRKEARRLQPVVKLKRTQGWKILMEELEAKRTALMEQICDSEDEKENIKLRAERRALGELATLLLQYDVSYDAITMEISNLETDYQGG